MARFLLIHHGGTPPASAEERDAMMAAMSKWMEGLGNALVDPGSPLGPPRSVGGEASAAPNGYMIIEADDQDEAVKMVEAMPGASGEGTRIDVHEARSG